MPIDPLNEQLITLTEATKLCPRRRMGKKPHTSTLYRWATKGKNGIVLETLHSPSGRFTSKEALRRFFAALSNNEHKVFSRSEKAPKANELQNLAAEQELAERYGI